MCDVTVSGTGLPSGIYRLQETVVIPVGEGCDLTAINTDHCSSELNGSGSKVLHASASCVKGANESCELESEFSVVMSDNDDGIQIICRNFCQISSTPASQSDPILEEETGVDTGHKGLVDARDGNFSSIVEIDGDRFVIHSRLAGSEEKDSSLRSLQDNQDIGYELPGSRICTAADSNSPIAEQCRRFFESRHLSRWSGSTEVIHDGLHITASDKVETSDKGDTEKVARPDSADSGRESGSEGLGSICSSSDIHGFVVRSDSQRSSASSTSDVLLDCDADQRPGPIQARLSSESDDIQRNSHSSKLDVMHRKMCSGADDVQSPTEECGQTRGSGSSAGPSGAPTVQRPGSVGRANDNDEDPTATGLEQTTLTEGPASSQASLEMKIMLLRHEMGSLMLQDDKLFRQLLALNDSIEALRVTTSSLSSSSSLSSLTEEEQDLDTFETSSSYDTMAQAAATSGDAGSANIGITVPCPRSDSELLPDVPPCTRVHSSLPVKATTLELAKITPARPSSDQGKSFLKDILHASGISTWRRARISSLLSSSSGHRASATSSH